MNGMRPPFAPHLYKNHRGQTPHLMPTPLEEVHAYVPSLDKLPIAIRVPLPFRQEPFQRAVEAVIHLVAVEPRGEVVGEQGVHRPLDFVYVFVFVYVFASKSFHISQERSAWRTNISKPFLIGQPLAKPLFKNTVFSGLYTKSNAKCLSENPS